MARPTTARPTQNPSGTWTAELPREQGSKRRVKATFDHKAQAEAWQQDGRAALAAGHPPPDPDDYRRPQQPTARPVTASDADMLFSDLAYRYHRLRYEYNHHGQPERGRDVLADINNHILPYFRGMQVADLAGLDGHELIMTFSRHLAGEGQAAQRPAPVDVYRSFTKDQVAELTERSHATVNRWLREGRLATAERDPATGQQLILGKDLVTAGLLASTSGGLEQSTAGNILTLLRGILDLAVQHGLLATNPAKGVTPHERYGGSRSDKRVQDEPLSLPDTARLAKHLTVPEQLVLWDERILGLRQGEAFGPLVSDVIDLGAHGLLNVDAQDGRTFLVRDEYWETKRTTRKEATKRQASRRVLVIPPALMRLIRVVIQAFHTDPETGEIDGKARLVPGIREPHRGGQHNFGQALKRAAKAEGLDEESIGYRITPHGLRRSLTTELAWSDVDELLKRRIAGHQAGSDVFARTYTLDTPDLRMKLEVARQFDAAIEEEIGDLMIPTAARNTWGRNHPIRDRLDHVETVLRVAGWHVDDAADVEDPVLTSPRAAAELNMAESTLRRKMQNNEIPATKMWRGEREVWGVRRSVVEALRQELDQRITLTAYARERGLSYHDAYQTLQRMGLQPGTRPGSRELALDESHIAALDREYERIEALHRRALPISVAAVETGKSQRTLRDWATKGKLEKDPETDSSGSTFVTRASLAAATETDRPLAPAPSQQSYPIAEVSRFTGLSTRQVTQLVRAGTLETVTVGRRAEVTGESLRAWATGYRPELLDAIGAAETARCPSAEPGPE